MSGIVSGIYRHTGKLRAVNKQALATVLPEEEGTEVKEEEEMPEDSSEKMPTAAKSKEPPPTRPPEWVRQLLRANPDRVVNKVRYIQSSLALDCELYLRIARTWFSVEELMSVGYLGGEWNLYSGRICKDRGKYGRWKLSKKFGLPIADGVREAMEMAKNRLACLGL